MLFNTDGRKLFAGENKKQKRQATTLCIPILLVLFSYVLSLHRHKKDNMQFSAANFARRRGVAARRANRGEASRGQSPAQQASDLAALLLPQTC